MIIPNEQLPLDLVLTKTDRGEINVPKEARDMHESGCGQLLRGKRKYKITCRNLVICQSTGWMLRLQLTLSCNLMLLNNLTII